LIYLLDRYAQHSYTHMQITLMLLMYLKVFIKETKFNEIQRKHALEVYIHIMYETDRKGNMSLTLNRL